jgi:heterodisulfide reductase subunit A
MTSEQTEHIFDNHYNASLSAMKKKIGSALVVGAGISGIRSALDLAEVGYRVTLIDKAPNLGGTLTQLD